MRNLSPRISQNNTIAIALLCIATLLEATAIGILPFRGYDTYSHIFWIAEWHKLWDSGIFYPRWLPGSFKGFGAPSFYFYPPLSFILTSLLYSIFPSLGPAAIGKLLGILAFVASGVTMWLYLRRRQSGKAGRSAFWASLLYMFAPYRFFDYAVRGAISEHLAFVFIPLVFWGIDLLAEQRQKQDSRYGIYLLSISLALLFLSNLPAAAVTGLGSFIYILIRTTKARAFLIGRYMLSTVLAFLLTAFYLIPIVTRFRDVQFNRLWLPVSVIFSSPFLALFTGKGLLINSYAFLSVLGACVLLIGIWSARKSEENIALFWMLVLIVGVQLPYVSRFLFYHVPPFTIIQLSYRFSVLLLLVVALKWHREQESHVALVPNRQPIAIFVVFFWSLGTIALAGLQLANVHVHRHDLLPLGEAPEYAPRWSRPYYDFGASLSAPFATDTTWAIWSDDSTATISDSREPYSDTVRYVAKRPGNILLRRSYWPTWHASLDGITTAISPDSLGRILIPAPAGRHIVAATLETEPSARIGTGVSVGTVILVCALWLLA